jgi:hypothetical protein
MMPPFGIMGDLASPWTAAIPSYGSWHGGTAEGYGTTMSVPGVVSLSFLLFDESAE